MPSAPQSAGAEAPEPDPEPWLSVEIVHDAGPWTEPPGAEALIRAAAHALAAHHAFEGQSPASACIALSDDNGVQRLNADFRGKDKPTNVLSFPAPQDIAPDEDGREPLGDIVIAGETVLAEAASEGIVPADHLQHLTIHGLLHLLGFDHETADEAEEMEALEIEILASLGIANPYTEPLLAQAPAARDESTGPPS